jgi:hypothetical protein
VRRTLTMLTAAIALVPATMFATASSAAPATGTLTVITLGRDGAPVKTTASVFRLDMAGVRYATGVERLSSGKPHKLPKGRYAVLVDVENPTDRTDTLGAAVVQVSGKTTTTIDARKGKAVTARLDVDPGPQYEQKLDAVICAGGSTWGDVGAWAYLGRFYVIPNPSKELQFAYMSTWSADGLSGDAYAVSGATTGLPKGVNGVFRRASLATINVSARRGPASAAYADLNLVPESRAGAPKCLSGLSDGRSPDIHAGDTPYTVRAHVTPGRWTVAARTSSEGESGRFAKTWTVAAGRTYTQTFYRSAWGPGHNLPEVAGKRLSFDTADMFTDGDFDPDSNFTTQVSGKSVTTVKLHGKVLSTKTTTNAHSVQSIFSYKLKSAGWYTLSTTARRYHPDARYPADMLSTGSSASFRFYANPKVSAVAPVYLTRFVPAGLDVNNRARPHSVTTVALLLDRTKQYSGGKLAKVAVKTVTAKASFDGGRTWRSVPVRRVAGTWRAVVANPSAGAVSLRAKVTDAKGDSSEVSVYRAYAIG